jgi:gephyrin
MADNTKLKAAILIVSDTAFHDPASDRAGATLIGTFEKDGAGSWDIPLTEIVPDDVLAIQRCIQRWADGEDFINLVVTTGGTGFAVKDSTPEVVSLSGRREV